MGDVYVKFDSAGRLGNRMFQYAFGYLLAKAKGCDVFHDEIPNFKIPRKIKNPSLPVFYTSEMGQQRLDLNYLVNTSANIVVDSFVQRAEYFINHRLELIDLFNIEQKPSINKDKLVLHIRETDYKDIGCFMGFDHYKTMIDNSGFEYKNVIIVTDNSYCNTVVDLKKLGCSLNTEGYVDVFTYFADDRGMVDFNTLLYSENIALSHSSFSWWPAFLGKHKQIIFPEPKGMWEKNNNSDCIDLYF